MRNRLALGVGLLAALAVAGWLVFRGQAPEETVADGATLPAPDAIVPVKAPARLDPLAAAGEKAFNAVCAACHGPLAAGRKGKGPPLVHPYYRPGHHADEAFFRAVAMGVRAHHWTFGDMPPQSGLTPADVKAIVAYVRALQRANGIC
ncbi:MAG: cytochrome c [Alphaproteobacteria bacterium]|nr:MAG: cytochrome c [Alphaproteobacteria bacterium]